MNRRWTAFGAGGWSPDGNFLLAGGEASMSLFTKLVVIDCATNEFAEIMRLGHGEGGQTCRWIKRSLLSAQLSQA